MTVCELTELVLRAQKGDNSAFEDIYLLTHRSVFNKIYCAVKNVDDAEDVLQNSYLTLIEKIGALKDPDSFIKWFDTIVTNKIKDYQRKKSPIILDEREYNDLSNLAEDDSEYIPHESVERADNIEFIRNLVAELSDKTRESVEMHYFENKSISEIAEELDLSEGAVKTRLFNGRKELKRKISAKKILITILILILLAIITIFTVSGSDEIFSKILYKFNRTSADFSVDNYYLDDYPETIEEYYTLSYVPYGFILVETDDEECTYVERYRYGSYIISLKQYTLNFVGTFDNENAETTTEVINGCEVLCLKNDQSLKYMWDNKEYVFLISIQVKDFPDEEARKIIEGVVKKDSQTAS